MTHSKWAIEICISLILNSWWHCLPSRAHTHITTIYIQIWYYMFCTPWLGGKRREGHTHRTSGNKQTRKGKKKIMKNVLSTATSGDEMAVIQGAFCLPIYTATYTQCRIVVPIYCMCVYCGKSTTNCRRIMINRSHERKKNHAQSNTNQSTATADNKHGCLFSAVAEEVWPHAQTHTHSIVKYAIHRPFYLYFICSEREFFGKMKWNTQ